MKTILKFSLVLLVAITTMGAHANNGDFLLKVNNGTGKEISFSVNDIQKAKITIYDKYHNKIYSEVATGAKGIVKTYLLEEFPDGVYFLEVETDLKKVTHEIFVSKEGSTLFKKSVAEVYKTNLNIKNENVATIN